MKLFVPGRICLFGEHSDWAGNYRRINGELEKGYTIIAGTNQGIYAEIKPHPSKLVIRTTLTNGEKRGPYEINMDRDTLLREAEKGEFFSYAAGVAYQILTHYRVRGLEIDNYETDLPVKKGLSSSAAFCVLVARAFNRMYDLKMTTRGEMELAYMGEITTPSRCGRMDQGCAFGDRPILMAFDGDKIDVKEITVGTDLHYVIVDLCASKDTREILNRLNHCYPFAENDLQKNVQEYLGPINRSLTHDAADALQKGDAQRLGELMTLAQKEFDEHLMPACPSQLTSPVLHKALSYKPLQQYIYGAKGVGSQGDGTAQFLAKDAECQQKIIEIIEQDLHMQPLALTLHSARTVRKAVIPAAGFGTRLFPASKAMKKELFPIIDKDGRAKPVIMAIVEEALSAGVEEICIIVQKHERAVFEDFFCVAPMIENYNKLSKENQEYSDYILEVGHKITFAIQETQDGFGHAVYCAKSFVGNQPFLLMLGDHLYSSDSGTTCARQLVNAYESMGCSIVGIKSTPGETIHTFGCVAGTWEEENSILALSEFAEKPSLDYARTNLRVPGLADNHYFSVFGQYVLQPEIFEYLEDNITNNVREKGEFQLTSCLDILRQQKGFYGYVVKGRRYDTGLPDVYRQSMIDFRNA